MPFATGETHKFESRYVYTLIGPWPEAEDIYRARSPIHFVDLLSSPMLVLQGADDHVVPPAQAEVIVEALEAKGMPYAYLPLRGRGPRVPQGGDDRSSARTRAVVLRADPGVRARPGDVPVLAIEDLARRARG